MAGSLNEWERWLNRSKITIVAAQVLLDQHLLADASSRIYYAMFYAAEALLKKDGFIVKKHASVLSFFGREYVKTGFIPPQYHQMLIRAFELRQKSDYDIYWETTADDVEAQLNDARLFIAKLENFITSNRES